MIDYAKNYDFAAAVEREYSDPQYRPMAERAAAWRLIPQLQHRQYPFGLHAGIVYLHRTSCAIYTGGKCACERIPELALPGLN